MPEALTSPFAQQPTNLEDPVPGTSVQQAVAANPFDAGGINLSPDPEGEQQAQPTQPAPPSSANPFDQAMAPQGEMQMSQLPEPTGLDSAMEQIREAGARLKNSFTVTPAESVESLKESGIFEDVKLKNGVVHVKRPGRKGFEKFDREKIELLGDGLDLGRIAFEGIIENLFRVGGGISGGVAGAGAGALEGGTVGAVGGSVVPGAGTVLGGATGAVTGGGLGAILGVTGGAAAGGAAGAIAATKAGDWVQEHLLGIGVDPNRDTMTEATMAGTMGAGFNLMAARSAKKRMASEFQRSNARKTMEFATEKATEAKQAVQDVIDSGIKLGDDGNFRLDPQQLTNNAVPQIEATAKELSKREAFRNFRRQQGETLKGAYQSIIETFGAKSTAKELGKDFVLTADHIKNAEGSILGNIRQMGKEAAGGQLIEAPRSPQLVNQLFQSLGGKVKQVKKAGAILDETGKPIPQKGGGVTYVAPTTDEVLRAKPGLTEAQAKSYATEVKKLQKMFSKDGGRAKIENMEAVYNDLTTKINSAFKSSNGRGYAMELVELKNAVRDDWTDMLGKHMPAESMEDYAKARSRYAGFKEAETSLRSLLKTENISRDALMKKMFEGTNSLNFARSAKAIMEENDPKFWKDLTSEYFDRLIQENTDVATRKVDWKAMSKKWGTEGSKSGLGREMRELLTEGSGIPKKGFDQLLHLGRLYQNSDFTAMHAKSKLSAARNAVNVAAPTFIGTKVDSFVNLLKSFGKDESMYNWLQEGGMEKVLESSPNLKRGMKQKMLDAMETYAPSGAKKVGKGVERVGGQGLKTGIRRDMEDEF